MKTSRILLTIWLLISISALLAMAVAAAGGAAITGLLIGLAIAATSTLLSTLGFLAYDKEKEAFSLLPNKNEKNVFVGLLVALLLILIGLLAILSAVITGVAAPPVMWIALLSTVAILLTSISIFSLPKPKPKEGTWKKDQFELNQDHRSYLLILLGILALLLAILALFISVAAGATLSPVLLIPVILAIATIAISAVGYQKYHFDPNANTGYEVTEKGAAELISAQQKDVFTPLENLHIALAQAPTSTRSDTDQTWNKKGEQMQNMINGISKGIEAIQLFHDLQSTTKMIITLNNSPKTQNLVTKNDLFTKMIEQIKKIKQLDKSQDLKQYDKLIEQLENEQKKNPRKTAHKTTGVKRKNR